MKTIKLSHHYFMYTCIVLLLSGLFTFQTNAASQTDTLIIYLSRTQNNKTLAQYIARTTGGDLAEIDKAIPYPKDYPLMRDQVIHELSEEIFPPLKENINTESYRRIIIIFPTWAMRLPPPVKTFLYTHNLQGKTIMPLNTNAGYGVGSGLEEIRKLTPNSNIKSLLVIKGGNEREGHLFVMEGETLKQAQIKIDVWLKQISEK